MTFGIGDAIAILLLTSQFILDILLMILITIRH